MRRTKLTLIKNDALEDDTTSKYLDKSKISNFWNTCPRKLEYLPKSHCNCHECPWRLEQAKYNFCFWRYLKDNTNVDGSLEKPTQAEISKMFGWTTHETLQYFKEADQELLEVLEKQGLREAFECEDDEYHHVTSITFDSENTSEEEDY